jgi:hypothetical protein
MARQLVPCDDHVLEIFLGQIVKQADFGLMAAVDLQNAAGPNGDMDRVWYSVQSFLVAAANVSKLIWPAYSKRYDDQRLSDREERLRELLDSDSLAALREKDIRNDFEHFDARVEDWAVNVQGRPCIDGNINAHLALRDIPQERWLRNLDTFRWLVTFRGKEYPLLPVVDALQTVRQRALMAAAMLRQRATRQSGASSVGSSQKESQR